MRKTDISTLGGRIRSIRQAHPDKPTIKQFGEMLGNISESAMTSYELNNVVPPSAVLELIKTKFNINPLYLSGESDVMHIPPDEDEEIIDRALADADPMLKALLLGIVKKPDGWRLLAESILAAADTLRDAGYKLDDKTPGE